MLNVSIAKRKDLQSYELTPEEAAVVKLLRKFKSDDEKKLIQEMIERILEARSIG